MLTLNFDWTIHPDSRISRLRPVFLQKAALFLRNCATWVRIAFRPKRISEVKIADELRLAVEYVHASGIEGDLAEFGSHGHSAGVLCKEIGQLKMSRNIHLFDSFEGLPESSRAEDVNSPLVKQNVWNKGAARSGVTPELLHQRMSRFMPREQIKIYPGWYKDTLSSIPEGQLFGFVHIDCDLYESTFEVLDYLFGRKMLPQGCLIYFDDWNSNVASPDFGERKAWRDITEKYQVQYTDSGSYSWDGHKFHVHCYV